MFHKIFTTLQFKKSYFIINSDDLIKRFISALEKKIIYHACINANKKDLNPMEINSCKKKTWKAKI